MNKVFCVITIISGLFFSNFAFANEVYGPYKVTLKGYKGNKTNSVSYSGQVARQVLHTSLKKLSSSGSLPKMLPYYTGMEYMGTSKASLDIIDPKWSEKFPIKPSTINEISSGKNLNGKAYKGIVNGWPGQMTGKEVIDFMIRKAAKSNKGVDLANGYNYTQLISKFVMGAVFYNQAVDGYLDEKLTKPNDKPYKKGAYYTGKEHVWDEAFGYWGAAAHTLTLSPKEQYEVAKKKNLKAADYNKDGVVDLRNEMTFAHAYYAASFDKGGKTNYSKTIMQAFIDGRKLIESANGAKFSDSQNAKLKSYVDIITSNWEKVIAESVFKYAGSVYLDMAKLEKAIKNGSSTDKAYSAYLKHWGELKGFALSLQTGKKNLGDTAVRLNRLIGFSPLLLNSSQVVGLDSKGNYTKDQGSSWEEYMLHMLKVQKLMVDEFKVAARNKDQLSGIADLSKKLGGSNSAEND
ncbi:MAG: DUF4856 domain-containing protein [Rhodospirillaceae bacterium]|nr:DUF4856 domain-containing protein [Rhodospirillaceae bacterium]|tara:strand:- start:6003 stop:7388 length:1386 start_codon:yes stop_codon:yes gene_type:complete